MRTPQRGSTCIEAFSDKDTSTDNGLWYDQTIINK